MKSVFSTNWDQSGNAFDRWKVFCDNILVPFEQKYLSEKPFSASIDVANFRGIGLTRFHANKLAVEASPRTIRFQNNKPDRVFLSLTLSGAVHVDQNGFAGIEKPGDFSIRDQSIQGRIEYEDNTSVLAIELPRARLEAFLGDTRHYANLIVNSDLPTSILARTFLEQLAHLKDQLTPDAAERMTSTGIDLIVASVAERMAMEPPKFLRNTLTVQRAKAYVEANLGATDLDPDQVAVAVGISLRQLQKLFHDQGRNIADWIWQRRLEVAAQRLSDPAYLHLQIGALAFGCGFVSQAHFSRRFRDRYGMAPSDYRHTTMVMAATH